MSGAAARRGRPLWALGGLLLAWGAMRAAVFGGFPAQSAVETLRPAPLQIAAHASDAQPLGRATPLGSRQGAVGDAAAARVVLPPMTGAIRPPPRPPLLAAAAPPRPTLAPAATVTGHNLLWMAAMSHVAIPRELVRALSPANPTSATGLAPAATSGLSRWSGDGWVLWRAGAEARLAEGGLAAPVYGGSQAGLVLRYLLAPSAPARPVAYLRAVRALGRANEGDLAAGLALRPLAKLPMTGHAEARLSRRGARLDVRPAAFASAGIDELPIAAAVTARGYLQAGYVGGSGATGFADGSLVIERELLGEAGARGFAGIATWGGAQKDAARLDVGPTASLRFRLGEGSARLSADYRLRIAGDAAPAAGAAVTLTAGF